MKRWASLTVGILLTATTGWADGFGTIDHGVLGVANTDVVTRVIQVTLNPSNDWVQCWGTWPWRADGTELAYTAKLGNSSTSDEICVMAPDGTDWRRLTFNDRCDSHASFTPNGSKIVFQRNATNNQGEIWIMDAADGANQTSLTAAHGGYVVPESGENKPMVSPDGTKIMFRSGDDDTNALWVMSISGLDPVRVTPEWQGEINKHSWSPDSRWILYNARESGASMPTDLYKIRPDGTELTSLTPTNDYFCANWAAFSPDGTKIAFHQNNHSWDPDGTNDMYKLSIMNPDGSDLHDIVTINENDDPEDWGDVCGPVSWSPNSQWLQFKTHNSNDNNVICIMYLPTEEVIQLTDGYDDYRAWWSPDGAHILFRDRGSATRDGNQYRDDLLVLELADPSLYARCTYLYWQDQDRNLIQWRLDDNCQFINMEQSPSYGKWSLATAGDLNQNGLSDTLWINENAADFKARVVYDGLKDHYQTWSMPAWKAVAIACVNKDRLGDLIWQDAAGDVWLSAQIRTGGWKSAVLLGSFPNASLAAACSKPLAKTGAYVYLQDPVNAGNIVYVYSINPLTYELELFKTYKKNDLYTRLQSVADIDGDGAADMIWHRKRPGLNEVKVWMMNPDHTLRERLGWKWVPGWTLQGAGR